MSGFKLVFQSKRVTDVQLWLSRLKVIISPGAGGNSAASPPHSCMCVISFIDAINSPVPKPTSQAQMHLIGNYKFSF